MKIAGALCYNLMRLLDEPAAGLAISEKNSSLPSYCVASRLKT